MSSRSRRLSSLGAVPVLGCPSSECRDRAAWRYAHDQFRHDRAAWRYAHDQFRHAQLVHEASPLAASTTSHIRVLRSRLRFCMHPISLCSALGSDVACIPYPCALLSAQIRLRCGSGGRQGYASRSPLDRIRTCSSSRRARRRVRCQSGTSASVSSAPGRSGWSACRAAAGEKR